MRRTHLLLAALGLAALTASPARSALPLPATDPPPLWVEDPEMLSGLDGVVSAFGGPDRVHRGVERWSAEAPPAPLDVLDGADAGLDLLVAWTAQPHGLRLAPATTDGELLRSLARKLALRAWRGGLDEEPDAAAEDLAALFALADHVEGAGGLLEVRTATTLRSLAGDEALKLTALGALGVEQLATLDAAFAASEALPSGLPYAVERDCRRMADGVALMDRNVLLESISEDEFDEIEARPRGRVKFMDLAEPLSTWCHDLGAFYAADPATRGTSPALELGRSPYAEVLEIAARPLGWEADALDRMVETTTARRILLAMHRSRFAGEGQPESLAALSPKWLDPVPPPRLRGAWTWDAANTRLRSPSFYTRSKEAAALWWLGLDGTTSNWRLVPVARDENLDPTLTE